MQNEISTNGQWNNEDKKKLACVVMPLIEMQKAYGRTMNMKVVLQGWQTLLADKYNVDQIIYALGKYALEKDDFPSPANLHKLLKPTEPKITESQFIEAQNVQKRNGYPQFSSEAYLIKDYHKQNATKQETYAIECDKISKLMSNSIKRIE